MALNSVHAKIKYIYCLNSVYGLRIQACSSRGPRPVV